MQDQAFLFWPSAEGHQVSPAFSNSKRGSCQESAAAVECAGPAVQLIPGKASTQRESKERRRGGNWEEGEGGKQSLKAWTSTPGEAQSTLLTSTPSSWAASTAALPSTSPML